MGTPPAAAPDRDAASRHRRRGGVGSLPHPRVRRGATRDEITRAYREQMKRYHPDRVGGLGDELQQVAHRKTLEIQRAYSELTGALSVLRPAPRPAGGDV